MAKEKDQVGRVIITFDHTGEAPLHLSIQNLHPLLAVGVMTLAYERLKRQIVAESISPVMVPTRRVG